MAGHAILLPLASGTSTNRSTKSLRTTQTSHAGCNRCTEHTGNPDSNTGEVSRIGEKPVLDVDPQPVNVTASESPVPTLRMQRPHPSDRGKRALTMALKDQKEALGYDG